MFLYFLYRDKINIYLDLIKKQINIACNLITNSKIMLQDTNLKIKYNLIL